MKKSQILFFITFICILFISIFVIFNKKESSSPTSNDKPTEERLSKGSGRVGYGMLGKDNKIIDSGSVLKDITNGKIDSKVTLNSYINNDRKYKILVMNNFRQVQFEANGNEDKSHEFLAKANTTVDTAISNKIDTDTKEVAYLMIKDPDLLIEKLDLDKAGTVQQVLPLRYSLENETIPHYQYESVAPLKTSSEDPIDNVFISETEDELIALMSAESGQEVYLTVGNPTDEVMDYALVSFLDWEQVPLINEEVVLYVTVNPNEKKVFQLKLPETDKKKNYQVLAFPFPYKTSFENFESHTVEGTFRTVIKPK
ncbi:hypothetical protein IGI01_11940 [Bacillus thuringiensis]|nr:hypothetical protein [Bacillus thuringiensis]